MLGGKHKEYLLPKVSTRRHVRCRELRSALWHLGFLILFKQTTTRYNLYDTSYQNTTYSRKQTKPWIMMSIAAWETGRTPFPFLEGDNDYSGKDFDSVILAIACC